MAVKKCPNGHWFDDAIYPTCPHCANEVGTIDRTVSVQQGSAPDMIAQRLEYDDVTWAPRLEYDDVTWAKYPSSNDDVTQALGNEQDERTVGVYHPSSGAGIDPVVGWLVCMEGPEQGRDYRLYSGKNSVGRSADNHVCIMEDATISRFRHAGIIYDPKGNAFYICPGNSMETAVNGQPLMQPMPLQDGDWIALGRSQFSFVAFCKGEMKWKL